MKSKSPAKSKEESAVPVVHISSSPEETEYLKTTKRTTIYVFLPLAQTYLEVLEELQSSVLASQGTPLNSSSLIPFAVTSAAALECMLNDSLVMYANYIVGLGSDKAFEKAFLSMSLRGKLDTAITLLSRNLFVIRHNTSIYQQLSKLIKIRNDLMHGKSFFDKQDVDVDHKSDGPSILVKVPEQPYQRIKIGDCTSPKFPTQN